MYSIIFQWYDLDDTEGIDYPGNLADNMNVYDVSSLID